MNKEKINDFIDVYSQELNLTEEIKQNLKELISNLVLKYQNAAKVVNIQKDMNERYIINPQNDDYSLEDFFLNRLLHNVIKVNKVYNLRNNTKGQYIQKEKKIELSDSAIDNQIDSKLIDKFESSYETVQQLARKKVINHEFEHGLQSRFDNGGISDNAQTFYLSLIKRLKEYKDGKYADQIIDEKKIVAKDIFSQTRISGGFANSSKNGRKECLTEIFNESESIDVSNCQKQMDIIFKNGDKLPIYNTESSNYLITNYAYMLKSLIGENLTFDSMYFDPDKTEKIFEERYGDIIEEAYGDDYKTLRGSKLSALDVLESILNDIKNSKIHEINTKSKKLNLVLVRCLERNVDIGKKIYSKQELQEQINTFKKYMIINDDKWQNSQLEHVNIITKLEQEVEQTIDTSIDETLKKYWENGSNIDEIKPYMEETYLEYEVNYLYGINRVMQNSKYNFEEIQNEVIQKYGIISDLSLGKIEKKTYGKSIPTNEKMDIDKLVNFMIGTEDIELNSLKRCEYLVNKFKKEDLSQEEKTKVDYITEKLKLICEIKQQEAIMDLKDVYSESRNKSTNSIKEIDYVIKQLPAKMVFNLELEKTLLNNSEKIYGVMNQVCSNAMTKEQFENFKLERLAYNELLDAQIYTDRESISYDQIERATKYETFQEINAETRYVKGEAIKMYDEWGITDEEFKGVDDGW